jgi:hypothetical protein
LLDLYPDAQFIHIHRNPFVVFQSTQKLYKTAVAGAYLQKPSDGSVTTGIIRRYKDMYDAYLDQVKLIPPNRFVEIKFEDFEKDIINQLGLIYEKLGLDGFNQAKTKFVEYIDQRSGYQKNVHPDIPEPLRTDIVSQWNRYFTEWGYTV